MKLVIENFKINGFTDSHNQCDRCGKAELKGTFHITTESGQDFHIGSSCIKSAWQMNTKEFEAKWFATYKQRLSIAKNEFFNAVESISPTSKTTKEEYTLIDSARKSIALKYGIKNPHEL